MGTRLVLPYGPTNEFIQKIIPDDEILQNKVLPTLDEFITEPECLSKFEAPLYNLIYQQYWEYFNWYNADEHMRQFLAPIVHTFKERTPVLCFPKFLPLVDEKEVYEYNEVEIQCGPILLNKKEKDYRYKACLKNMVPKKCLD